MTKRRGKTADELLQELGSDPSWRAAEDARRLGRELRARRGKEVEAPVVAALHDVGYDIEWLSDLYSQRLDYESAVPILIDWLPRATSPAVLESLVRALTVKWARPQAARPLIDSFTRTDDDSTRWAIANALEVVADASVYDDIAVLIRDRSSGRARQMLVLALARMPARAADAAPLLFSLLGDPEVEGHAIIALGKLGIDAPERIKPFEYDDRAWVRAEAVRALERMRRSGARSKR